ncbi:hypothetical protein [Corynebacterium epidermidicanis]|uniref:Uncharacterized protein n=1 Tax=Corynebacterium epidermidicanis TaxID=1050174 RepID=A0A0G3GQT3_9CORY|nr:hypothetical protein [Corynebacterium epidermidicanis]AKK03499.1 hypothetical protein CEPID_08245 [Corynebacterium epidermidicanis]
MFSFGQSATQFSVFSFFGAAAPELPQDRFEAADHELLDAMAEQDLRLVA